MVSRVSPPVLILLYGTAPSIDSNPGAAISEDGSEMPLTGVKGSQPLGGGSDQQQRAGRHRAHQAPDRRSTTRPTPQASATRADTRATMPGPPSPPPPVVGAAAAVCVAESVGLGVGLGEGDGVGLGLGVGDLDG